MKHGMRCNMSTFG